MLEFEWKASLKGWQGMPEILPGTPSEASA